MNIMDGIIIWCNNNQGFINMILSIFTLITSIIAIFISIHTAKIPYKKKIKINPVFEKKFNDNIYFLKLYITNIGYKTIGIEDILITFKNYEIGNIYNSLDTDLFIKPTEYREYGCDLIFDNCVNEEDVKNVKIKIVDTEGQEYKYKVPFAMG